VSTVAVAEASAVLAAGARAVLEQGGYAVWTAASLDELLAVAAESPPEVALVDLGLLPDGGGTAIASLGRYGTRTVVWGFDPSPESVLGAVAAGAAGFLGKTVTPAELVVAIQRAAAGNAVLGEGLAGVLVTGVQQAWGDQRVRESSLSSREERVLELVSEGLRNREIAATLAISEFTVKRHVQNILRKLELPSRRAAAAFHRRHADATRTWEPA
jgi:DNA-binding NarL/FixJ family response regulator